MKSPFSPHCGLALVFILNLSTFGCAGGGPKPPTAAELAGRDARVVVVAPLNVASSLPLEIEGSSEIVSATLVQYLEEHGKSAQVLGFRVGRGLWLEAIRTVNESRMKRSFESAASLYAREIAKQVDYDVLIIPTLYIQNVEIRSKSARWDNAREPIRIDNRNVISKKDMAFDSMRANIRAASMMAAIFSSDGSAIQSEKHGLQTIEHVELSAGTGNRRDESYFDIVSNSPPLDDPVKIRAGIAGALSPFLPELELREAGIEAEAVGPE